MPGGLVAGMLGWIPAALAGLGFALVLARAPRTTTANALLESADLAVNRHGPTLLAGLVLAACVQSSLSAAEVSRLSGQGLDLPLLAIASLLVPTAALIPVCAALWAKGASAGAVLAGAVLGPLIQILGRGGWPRPADWIAALAGTGLLSLAADRLITTPFDPPANAISAAAVPALLLIFVLAIARDGSIGWLQGMLRQP